MILLDATTAGIVIGVIGVAVSVVGLGYSIASWQQAKGAKKAAEAAQEAAQEAGKIVKIQDILLDIPEIVNLCQLDFTDDYIKASSKLSAVINKVSVIIGVIKIDNNQKAIHQTLVSDIENTINQLREILKGLNPIYAANAPTQIMDMESGRVYYAITPDLQILGAHLNKLTGNLHGQMIQK